MRARRGGEGDVGLFMLSDTAGRLLWFHLTTPDLSTA